MATLRHFESEWDIIMRSRLLNTLIIIFIHIHLMNLSLSFPRFQLCFGLHHLLREIFGSLAAKCSTMFTSWSLTVPVCCWAGSWQLLFTAFLNWKWCYDSSGKRPKNQNNFFRINKNSVGENPFTQSYCHHLIYCNIKLILGTWKPTYRLKLLLPWLLTCCLCHVCCWVSRGPAHEQCYCKNNGNYKWLNVQRNWQIIIYKLIQTHNSITALLPSNDK